MALPITFLSLLLEAVAGYPDALFRAIGHPVTWIGRLIAFLDLRLNRADRSDARRRALGVAALLVIAMLPGGIGFAIHSALTGGHGWPGVAGIALLVLIATSLLAQKSLARHVSAVAQALERQGLEGGRREVAKIVGRDPEQLDGAAVCRAAIESLAENFSDGVVAPAFWLAVGGLGAGAAYKAVNTADSMIGHKTERHRAFGWACARFDDLVNLPASRLTALLIVTAAAILPGMDARSAWRAVWRDAGRHRSPNAGWPEAAMAGALGLGLNGPRSYGGVAVNDAVMGEGGRREARPHDIRRALRLYWTADLLFVALLGLGALALR